MVCALALDNLNLRYFTILDVCSSGENRLTVHVIAQQRAVLEI